MNPLLRAMALQRDREIFQRGQMPQEVRLDIGNGYQNTILARPPMGNEVNPRYYLGHARSDDNYLSNMDAEAFKEAMFKMQYAPQDSIPSHMVYGNLNRWRR